LPKLNEVFWSPEYWPTHGVNPSGAYDDVFNPVNAGFAPVAGFPLSCQTPFLAQYIFPLSMSNAVEIISFVVKLFPQDVDVPPVCLLPSLL